MPQISCIILTHYLKKENMPGYSDIGQKRAAFPARPQQAMTLFLLHFENTLSNAAKE